MSFSRRLAAPALVVLGLAYAGLCALVLQFQAESLRKYEEGELAAVSVLVRASLSRMSEAALAQAQTLARQPDIASAIARQDRAALVETLGDAFAYLKARAGVAILQIQTADLKILARLQDPARHGDDVSQSRPIVVTVNRTRQEQSGLEIGPTGVLALRGVAPALSGGRLVGTTEVGFELDPILRSVKAASGADIAIVLSSAMTGVAAPDSRAAGDLVLAASTDHRLFERLLPASGARLAREPLQFDATLDGEAHGLTVQPLLDYSGRMIGGVVGARNFAAAQRASQRGVQQALFIAFCGFVVSASLLVVALGAFVTRPLAALDAYLAEAAAGRRPDAVPPAGGAPEVERIAQSVAAIGSAARADAGVAR